MIMVSKDKAYIVANEHQEHKVLEKLERDGFKWLGGAKPTEFRPAKGHVGLFPYVIYVGYGMTWNILTKITSKEIVYDGRKEDNMSDKYVVSQEFMDELEEWKIDYLGYVSVADIDKLPSVVCRWWINSDISDKEDNNRLIAILRWVNGEDVFEVEKPKKWVVRSKELNANGDCHYGVLAHFGDIAEMNHFSYYAYNATKFDTKEEAESWANSHQEVIEVEE